MGRPPSTISARRCDWNTIDSVEVTSTSLLVSTIDLNIGDLVAQVSGPQLSATFLGLIKKNDWTLRHCRISLIGWIMQATL